MSFFGREALAETARRQPARPQATLGEAAGTAWETQWELYSSLSAPSALYDEYEAYRDELRQQTGEGLFNPLASGGHDRRRREKIFFEHVETLRKKYPDIPTRTPESIRAKIAEDRQRLRERAADVEERTQGFWANTAAFGTTMGAAILDPPVLLTLGAGAPVHAGILRAALTEAALGIGSEAVVQTGVQLGRQEFGEDPSLSEAALNIGLVGAGSFGLTAVLRGGAKGLRALVERTQKLPEEFRTPEVRAAEANILRTLELEEARPYIDTPEGRILHQQQIDAAIKRMAQTDTAVGRVLDARLPQKVEVEISPTVRGEPAEVFLARARASAPKLFEQLDDVSTQLDKAAEKLQKVKTQLAEPSDVLALAGELDALQRQRAAATAKRKIKRLDRKIEELRARSSVDIEKEAKKTQTQQIRLQNQRDKLTKQIEKLRLEKEALTIRADRAIQKTEAISTPGYAIKARMVVGPSEDKIAKMSRDFIDFAEKAREAVGQKPSVRAEVRTESSSPAAATAAADETIILDEQAVKARAELMETQVRKAIELDPEMKLEVPDADGNLRIVTGQELLDDLADDEALLKELKNCMTGALT